MEFVGSPDAGFSVIIPALNEEATIASVVRELKAELGEQLRECVVVDNGSTDATAAASVEAGARVVSEPRRGYGRACIAGVEHSDPLSSILVFMDGDGSDVPAEIPALIVQIAAGNYDFAIGSRMRGRREPGSMLASQIFAARLVGWAVRMLYGVRYSDMGPMRAITRSALRRLGMTEVTYGWNLEMQMKAARMRMRIVELPVAHRCRQGGQSKVAGSLLGSIKAALRIMQVLFRIGLASSPSIGRMTSRGR